MLIIGPSGVGKSVILRELRALHPEWHVPRSATTRKRRHGEDDGLYRFVNDTEFDILREGGELLEWAVVHDGPRYGTLIEEIIPPIDEGQIVVREVDVQGFESIRMHTLFSGKNPPYFLRSIFILPQNREQLRERIRSRAPIDDEELKRRLESMEHEMSCAQLTECQIVNAEGKLNEAVEAVERIEAHLGKPVVTSNQAMMFCLMRALGLPRHDALPGRLFDQL